MIANRKLKDARYVGFSTVGKVFSNSRRLELLDILIQRPHSVDELATNLQQSVASTSQHLQVLKRAKVVVTKRKGTTIIYSLAEGTLEVFVALRALAENISSDLQMLHQQSDLPTVGFEYVQHILKYSSAILLDVRTKSEFAHRHMEGAINIPLSDLLSRYTELSISKPVIVTCRGPYCVSSDEAAHLLEQKGFAVSRYDDGVGEWCVQGGDLCGPI